MVSIACTVGAQPSDAEVWAFVLARYRELTFSEPEPADGKKPKTGSPKRMQREAARAVARAGVGTKAQQALKRQFEAGKRENRALGRAERLALEEKRFRLRQEKKKAKHRGR